MSVKVGALIEHFPIRGAFVISRERRTVQTVVRVILTNGTVRAQGECVPYRHYGETPEGVVADILALAEAIEGGLTRDELQYRLPHGAARNGLDCAFWDFEAKTSGKPVWQLAGLPRPHNITTMQTVSLGTPEEMHAHAKRLEAWPVLKIKLGGDGDDARIRAVRAASPKAKLVADPNEAWRQDNFEINFAACVDTQVDLIEQPFPAGEDSLLENIRRLIPFCADESLHDRTDLPKLRSRYDAVNIKLDKAGGLTEALQLRKEAEAQGFKIFVGSMVATSLAIAPAVLLAQTADFVDLDPPLLLEKDRMPPLGFDGAQVMPPLPELWG